MPLTMTAFILFTVLVVMGAMDWLRGSGVRLKYFTKTMCLLTIGLCVAYLLGQINIYGLTITALTALGGSVGMGNALGPALHNEKPDSKNAEWWQKGPLLKSAWASLVVLGILWGVAGILTPWVPGAWTVTLAYAMATPLAAWYSVLSVGGLVLRVDASNPRFEEEVKNSNRAWATFNTLRSPIAGVLIIILQAYVG